VVNRRRLIGSPVMSVVPIWSFQTSIDPNKFYGQLDKARGVIFCLTLGHKSS
jgi:hypothetical protein